MYRLADQGLPVSADRADRDSLPIHLYRPENTVVAVLFAESLLSPRNPDSSRLSTPPRSSHRLSDTSASKPLLHRHQRAAGRPHSQPDRQRSWHA